MSGGQGGRVLHRAISSGKGVEELIALLAEEGASAARESDDRGNLPLHAALHANAPSSAAVEILAAHPGAARDKDHNGLLPLHLAAGAQATIELVEQLIAAHPDAARETDGDGALPLHRAVRSGACGDVVRALTSAYPQAVSALDSRGRAPLHLAASLGASSDVIEQLLRSDEGKAVALLADKDGWPPLHRLLESGAPLENVQLLLTHAPDSAKERCGGCLPLHRALEAAASDDVIEAVLKAHPTAASEADGKDKLPIVVALSSCLSKRVVEALLLALPREMRPIRSAVRLALDDSKKPVHNGYETSAEKEKFRDRIRHLSPKYGHPEVGLMSKWLIDQLELDGGKTSESTISRYLRRLYGECAMYEKIGPNSFRKGYVSPQRAEELIAEHLRSMKEKLGEQQRSRLQDWQPPISQHNAATLSLPDAAIGTDGKRCATGVSLSPHCASKVPRLGTSQSFAADETTRKLLVSAGLKQAQGSVVKLIRLFMDLGPDPGVHEELMKSLCGENCWTNLQKMLSHEPPLETETLAMAMGKAFDHLPIEKVEEAISLATMLTLIEALNHITNDDVKPKVWEAITRNLLRADQLPANKMSLSQWKQLLPCLSIDIIRELMGNEDLSSALSDEIKELLADTYATKLFSDISDV